jgi:hypothetical protein
MQGFFLQSTHKGVAAEHPSSHRNERFDRFCPLLITKNSPQPNDSGNGKQCSSKYTFELHVAMQQLKPKLSTMFPL